MQNMLLMGIVLASIIGSGAVIGIGAMDGRYNMHSWMHGGDYEDCHEHEDCEYEHEECEEHLEEECFGEHEDCDMNEHMRDHGC
ncbi:MAG: hypothetical protein JSV09_08935 [Thermoplasmata archaeon]|nr:MAG: hypothetical protein JSV09_08935 [Thermoplasmata archaeon]